MECHWVKVTVQSAGQHSKQNGTGLSAGLVLQQGGYTEMGGWQGGHKGPPQDLCAGVWEAEAELAQEAPPASCSAGVF